MERTTLQTGLVIDPRYRAHDTGPGHPERAQRISALIDAVDSAGRAGIHRVPPRAATADEIALVHLQEHVERVAASAAHDRWAFDPDTTVSSASYATALLAAGGVLELCDAVMEGTVDNGFALVRPPGHHAERDRAMGFCLFNSVAVAARHLQQSHGIERVMIVDWDVHHGNGTQHIFESDPSVLYLSTHQYPFYPGTGGAHEVGTGDGEGTTVNLPLPAGCDDGCYVQLFERVVEPICRQFQPEFVLVSAGFDAHTLDPLAGMAMTSDGFAALARVLLRAAADIAGNRCVMVLEGGYHTSALAESVLRVIAEMEGARLDAPVPASPFPSDLIEPLLEIHRRFWELSEAQ